ncbi:MAG: Hsp20/alpha crystallin family protein [bacterium]|nr:Hsp20/alpha crystallin family protein [bacterium]
MSETLGPLMEVARIQSEINRLFDNLLDLRGEEGTGGAWLPNADILETDEHLIVKVELPGVDPSDLGVSVHGGDIIISGEKRPPRLGEAARMHAAERAFGPFRRVIHLGVPVNTRQAVAEIGSGLLRIAFPKVPNRRGEEVPIEVNVV